MYFTISETTNCEFNIFLERIKSFMYLFNALFFYQKQGVMNISHV